MPSPGTETIQAAILAALSRRDAGSSLCPSEVARSLAPEDDKQWRSLMPRIREAAVTLLQSGRIVVTRGASPLQPGEFDGGPIRLRRGPKF